ncbi:MAG: phosphatase PAP2 family protein [Paracoccaceae bacterium]
MSLLRTSFELALFLCGTLLILGVFLVVFPNIDIAVSMLFGDTNGFPLAESPILRSIRRITFVLTDWTMGAVLVILIANLLFRGIQVIPKRILAFALASYLIGPGLIVNGLLKRYSGRARPRQINIFGGDKEFSPALTFADQCESNCSFASGEASALATVSTILILVAVPRLPESRRVASSACILAVAAFGSGLRVAFGAHFLSDIVFAWLVSITVVMGLHVMFGIGRYSAGCRCADAPPNQP